PLPLLEADVPRSWCRRAAGGLWRCDRTSPPTASGPSSPSGRSPPSPADEELHRPRRSPRRGPLQERASMDGKSEIHPVFGELIHCSSRADALADGTLVDVSEVAREAGIRYPVALTRAVWEACVR